MTGGEILFLAHRVPFPPDRGDRIRAHHLLAALAELAPVHAGCFAGEDTTAAHIADLVAGTASHCVVPRTRPVALAGLAALATRAPVSLAAFDSAHLHRWVAKTLAERPIGTIFVFSGQMGQYVPDDFAGRLIVDLCDVDSAKFESYGEAGHGPRAWIDRREGRLLAIEEDRLAHRATRTLLVSEEEAALLTRRLRDPQGLTVEPLRNGIDSDGFDPQVVAQHPQLVATPGPHLVFTGQMDYKPNIAAVRRVADHLLPAIRRHHPEATFHVVGRAPTATVRALHGQGGMRVWGEVPDVRPFLAAADVVLAPLTIARGVQNKVLEAMAMARPVVLSREAATGIGARPGEHFAVGEDDAALVAKASALIDDRARAAAMGAAARRFVVERMGWRAMLAPLAGMVGARRDGERRNAA